MTKKILIIEDEELIANVFKKQLSILTDFEVDYTLDPKEGLNLLENNKYDVLLLDLVLPNVDGLEILSSIKTNIEKYHYVKVVVLSNVTSDEIIDNAKNLGAEYFITKIDVKPDELIKIIQDLTIELTLGQKIRRYRKRINISQLDLEMAIDAAPGSISRIEKDKVNPTKETLRKIEQILHLTDSEKIDLYEFNL